MGCCIYLRGDDGLFLTTWNYGASRASSPSEHTTLCGLPRTPTHRKPKPGERGTVLFSILCFLSRFTCTHTHIHNGGRDTDNRCLNSICFFVGSDRTRTHHGGGLLPTDTYYFYIELLLLLQLSRIKKKMHHSGTHFASCFCHTIRGAGCFTTHYDSRKTVGSNPSFQCSRERTGNLLVTRDCAREKPRSVHFSWLLAHHYSRALHNDSPGSSAAALCLVCVLKTKMDGCRGNYYFHESITEVDGRQDTVRFDCIPPRR